MPMSATPFPVSRFARAALLFACASIASAAQALSPSEFFARVSPSVWLVRTFDKAGMPLGTGSAVVIAPHTLITNCHVLKDVQSFQLENEGRRFIGRLELWDTARDVCQVKVPHLEAPAVVLGDSDKVVVGQPVYALGAPKGLELTLSNGIVSGLRHNAPGQLWKIQTSAPISHGSSGGGLFDIDGRLIGITSEGIEEGQNLGFALPVSWVRELPARHAAAGGKDTRPVAVTAPTPRDPDPSPVPPPLPLPSPPALAPAPVPVPVPAPAPAPTIIARTPAAPKAVPRPAPAPAPAPVPVPVPAPVETPTPVIAATAPPAAPLEPAGPRIPFLNDQRQREYWHYVNEASYPKACAISDNGHYACTGGTRPKDRSLSSDPKTRALKRCAELAGRECLLYQVDDRIVYRPPAPTPEP